MSHNTEARMAAKSFVKKSFVEDNGFLDGKKILCVIPVVAESRLNKYLCLNEVNNKPLMAYIIEEAKKIDVFDTIILDTEDPKISEVGKEMGIEVPFYRPIDLAHLSTHQVDIISHLLMKLKEKRDYLPDILVLLHYNYPMMKKEHIEKAIHTMLIHNTDSVLSVSEDLTFHYQPGKYGLKPIVFRQRYLREEKVRTYKESGGIIVVRPENIMKGNLLGKKIGHIVMQPHETIRIETEHDYWIFEQMVKQGWTAKKGL
jgi:CMP-N-acetylneuraminic acid synthetase